MNTIYLAQCCTFEQARQLKNFGVNQHSLFSFVPDLDDNGNVNYGECDLLLTQESEKFIPIIYNSRFAAFNVAELGRVINDGADQHIFESYYSNHLGCWNWQVLEPMDNFFGNGIPYKVYLAGESEFDTEAEARAEMLLKCIEDGIITVEMVNDALLPF